MDIIKKGMLNSNMSPKADLSYLQYIGFPLNNNKLTQNTKNN